MGDNRYEQNYRKPRSTTRHQSQRARDNEAVRRVPRPKKSGVSAIPTGAIFAAFAVFIVVIIAIAVKTGKNNSKKPDYSAINKVEHASMTPTPKPEGWGLVEDVDMNVIQNLNDRVFLFSKSEGMKLTVAEDDYIHKNVILTVSGLGGKELNEEAVTGVFNKKERITKFSDILSREDCPIGQAFFEMSEDGDSCTIKIAEKGVYCWKVSQDQNYFYLEAYKPHEMYDAVVVIDAGHGGEDGGCEYFDFLEKDLTLQYSNSIRELAGAQDKIGFFFTRRDDANLVSDYGQALQMRPDFANEIEADLFLSIHMNANKSSKMNGSSIYFNEYMDELPYTSRAFAKAILTTTLSTLGLKDMGMEPAAETLSITKYAKMPVALLEVGFLSNEKDMRVITSQDNIQKMGTALYGTITDCLREMGKIK